MLLNIDNIPYVGRDGEVSYRTDHAIAQKISEYVEDQDVFYIEIFTGEDLTLVDLTEIVPADILNRIQSGDVKIAFHNIHEAFHTICLGIIKTVIKYDIDTSDVIIMTSNHDMVTWASRVASRLNVDMPRIILVEVFEIQASCILEDFLNRVDGLDNWIKCTYNTDKITHRYLNLNRRQRAHRVMLVTALLAKKLHTSGKISFGNSDFEESSNQEEIISSSPFYWMDIPDIVKIIDQKNKFIMDSIPMYLDTDDLVTNRAVSKLAEVELYNTTGISVVSETTFFSSACPHGNYTPEPGVFLSEKAWKPVLHHHPWVMVSQPYTQQAMKNYGYQTFSELWDESYDYEENDVQRMYMLLKLIEKFHNWSTDKFMDIIKQSENICRHNLELLRSKQHGSDFISELVPV